MSRDPLDAKTVHAADPGPSGSELAALNHSMTDVERDNFGRGIAANAERLARMTAADIDRKLDDLEAPRG